MLLLACLLLSMVVSLESRTQQLINFTAASTHGTVAANVDVEYIENGVSNTALAPLLISTPGTLNTGWYYVNGETTISGTLTVVGNVNLILEDNCHLQINASSPLNPSIKVHTGQSLTIYAQTNGTGKLTATAISGTGIGTGAGIGGGGIYAAGTVTISGGIVIATGGEYGGAGIGGGKSGAGGTITISGGSVTATGGGSAAGIGGGADGAGGKITISGGTVTAKSGSSAAGIGGGNGGAGGTITISGGTVVATGGNGGPTNQHGAGIGGGYEGDGGTVIITGGSVKAVKGSNANVKGTNAEDIGGGVNASNSGFLTNGIMNVYRNTLKIISPQGNNEAVTNAIIDSVTSTYGLNGVVTDSTGQVYFYLPTSSSAEDVVLTVGGLDYFGSYTRPAVSDPITPGRELLGCTGRSATSGYTYPCGTSDCYEQLDITTGNPKTGTGSCDGSELCPGTLSVAVNGKCELLNCTERNATSSYTYPCGTSDCYEQLDTTTGNSKTGTGSCGGSELCPGSLSVAANGKCELLNCTERNVTSSYTYPCGTSDCYEQLDTTTVKPKTGDESCGLSCPGISAATNGKCELLNCTERNATSGYTYPCGTSDCYEQLDTASGNPKTGTGSCGGSELCPGTLSVAINGKCELLNCTERNATSSYTYPCGTSDCYELLDLKTGSLKSGDGSCGANTSCPLTLSKASDGVCAVLDCTAREVTLSYTFPCGTSDCYQQLDDAGTRLACNRYCHMNVSKPDIPSGMCKYLVCQQRLKDDVYGCGSDCYYFPDYMHMMSAECVVECPPNYMLGEDGFQCEPKSCTSRERSHGCDLPSDDPETERCFVHNNDTCVSACPEGFSPEVTQHACVAVGVKARSGASFPWWVIAVVLSLLVAGVVVVIIVFLIRKNMHKEGQKNQSSQQRQVVLLDTNSSEGDFNDHSVPLAAVVLMEEESVKDSPRDISVDHTEMDVMLESKGEVRSVQNEEEEEEEEGKQKE